MRGGVNGKVVGIRAKSAFYSVIRRFELCQNELSVEIVIPSGNAGNPRNRLEPQIVGKNMVVATESMWIGRLEVSPQEDAEDLRDVSGAFVNVVTWASSEAQFREKAKIVMNELKLAIITVEDAEPIANRGVLENEELLEIVARVQGNPNAIIYSTFHTWREEPV